MPRKAGPKAELSAASRQALLDSAAREFTDYGYELASIARIAREAGMAQGTVYYYHRDKKSLFSAVYQDRVQRALTYMQQHPRPNGPPHPYQDLVVNCLIFLKLSADDTFRRIVLLEALHALSYDARAALRAKSLYGALLEQIKGLKNKGNLEHIDDVDGYATALYGILCELGRSLEYAKNQGQALEFAKKTTSFFLEKTLQG